jgi:hypothetical protein
VYAYILGAHPSSITLQKFDVFFLRKGRKITVARAIRYRTMIPDWWRFLLEAQSDVSFLVALDGLWEKILSQIPVSAQNMQVRQWTVSQLRWALASECSLVLQRIFDVCFPILSSDAER